MLDRETCTDDPFDSPAVTYAGYDCPLGMPMMLNCVSLLLQGWPNPPADTGWPAGTDVPAALVIGVQVAAMSMRTTLAMRERLVVPHSSRLMRVIPVLL